MSEMCLYEPDDLEEGGPWGTIAAVVVTEGLLLLALLLLGCWGLGPVGGGGWADGSFGGLGCGCAADDAAWLVVLAAA